VRVTQTPQLPLLLRAYMLLFFLILLNIITILATFISCCKHLGQIISHSGFDWPPRLCTEAATSTFVDFHAPISCDICDFGIDCSVGDVLTYLFHMLNFQELVPRHVFCNNINDIIEYANKEFVTIDLQCFGYFDTVVAYYKFNVCCEFSDTLLHCIDDQLPTRICNFYNQGTCASRGNHHWGQTLWKHLCKRCFGADHAEPACPLSRNTTGSS
jgi:hypothetical protein